MKKIYLIITVLFLSYSVRAQLRYDEYGTIIPFSQIEEYQDKINWDKVNTYHIPAQNNDSLCRIYNNGKSLYEIGSDFTAGIPYDSNPFNLKKKATKIKVSHGTIWLYIIESPTAEEISIIINDFDLSPGTYLSFIADKNAPVIQYPEVYHADNIPERIKRMGIFSEGVFGTKMIIEYFEPDDIVAKNEIIIDRIYYNFVGLGKKKVLKACI